MKMRVILYVVLLVAISRVSVNADRHKELEVRREIISKPYTAEQSKIVNAIIEIMGKTIVDTTDNWLTYGDSCDLAFHQDGLSTNHNLSIFYNRTVTKQLCSIFEDLVCDTADRICKCWTAGGIGKMEWQPKFENLQKTVGRCVMSARQRCGSLDMPPGLYPHVDFPLLRDLPCDKNNKFHCHTDLDGAQRCSNENESSHGTRFTIYSNRKLYTIAFLIRFYVTNS